MTAAGWILLFLGVGYGPAYLGDYSDERSCLAAKKVMVADRWDFEKRFVCVPKTR